MLKSIKTRGSKAWGARPCSSTSGISLQAGIYKDLPVGLCYLDTDFRFIQINDWLAEINGIPAEEHLGRTIGELIPDFAAGVEAQVRQVIDTGEPIIGGTVEAETPAQPGIKRHFQHSYYPVRSDDGEIIGISCVVEDVSVRNEALAALQQAHDELDQRVRERTAELQGANTEIAERKRAQVSLQRAEFALDHASDAALWLDRDGRVAYANGASCRLLGYSRDELLGSSVTDYDTDASLDDFALAFERIKAHGPSRFKALHRTKGGEYIPVEVSIHYMRFGNAELMCSYSRDITERTRAEAALREAHDSLEQRVRERTVELEREITERKHAEEALLASERALKERVADLEEAQYKLERQGESLFHLANDLLIARDEARAADRAKSEFLAAMSHELRTPLNAIIGFSEIIMNETFGPVGSVKYREYSRDIHASGRHLLSLINDILDLSKVESGKDELQEDTIEIPEIIRSALKLVGQLAEQGGIKLELELADQLPALRADERKLKQILVNLLSNAVKFTDAGGNVTLRAWCRMDSGYVIQIVDTGLGIAPEDIPKALSRFGQVDGDLNRQYEGTGLGLPLTKALVELHGGSLDLQSEVGMGTTVTVRFPAERIVASLDDTHSLSVEDRAAS